LRTVTEKVIGFIKKYNYIFIMAFPFVLMQAVVSIIGADIDYFRPEMVLPWIMFTASYIGLFVGVCVNVPHIIGRIIYVLVFALFFAMYLVQGVYYYLMSYFFGFDMMGLAGEASAYMWDAVINARPMVYVFAILMVVSAVVAIVKIPRRKDVNLKWLGIVIGAFTVIHIVTPFCYGSANDSLEWDNWRNPRNVYESFNDPNKSMKICGLFEYTVRDFFVNYIGSEEADDPEELAYLDELYSAGNVSKDNKYTGIFQGKNVIFLQLEGIDDWMFNAEDMPATYGLLENAMVFTDHYSFYNGGGSTFNSEFAVNTGFVTPISYNRNAYSFSGNDFKYSLANTFKKLGYSTNAFHMNTKEYYSRGMNYDSWGFDNYYGLTDVADYDDISYELDRELILNETFNELIFGAEGSFLHYIITYTPHTPFTTDKGVGELILNDKYPDRVGESLSEEESARLFAGETDYMVSLLLKELEENGLLENTVIVAFADHYLYTLNDKSILDKYKTTENNLINHTPFFIWSYGMEKIETDKVNSQLDILPTVLNLFGIKYVEEYYIGKDIFDENYSGYVFFNDYSWYDGDVYVQDGAIVQGEKMELAKLYEMNDRINKLIRQNDLTLKYDYFGKMEQP